MAKLEKFVEQTDWFWYSANLTEEQTAEWEAYEAGEADEPEAEPPQGPARRDAIHARGHHPHPGPE